MSSMRDWISIDNGIFLQKINEGKGTRLAAYRNGAVIKCSFKLFMFLDDGEKDADRRTGKWIELETRSLESFQIGENDLVKGLEIIFMKGDLRIGDKFRARIDQQYGYGSYGRPEIQLSNLIQAIPPNTDLEYVIEIADVSYIYPYPHSFAVDKNTSNLTIAKAKSFDVDSKEEIDLLNPNTILENGVVAFINLR
jgi:hypothetical protein